MNKGRFKYTFLDIKLCFDVYGYYYIHIFLTELFSIDCFIKYYYILE